MSHFLVTSAQIWSQRRECLINRLQLLSDRRIYPLIQT
jgi:hypothetical protein